ncbi:MAG: transglycosylase SLT domain-containing protein [Bacteroidales bacterium]|nr:transglycosylase SLT domain-containing protein [Bacteroidales bacterium]
MRRSHLLLILAALLLPALWPEGCRQPRQEELRVRLRAVINLGRPQLQGGELTNGYHYYLLQRFAEAHESTVDIRLAPYRETSLDSLRDGSADIIVLPFSDSAKVDSTMAWVQIDSVGIWILDGAYAHEAGYVRRWLDTFRNREDYPRIRQHFFQVYDPFRRISADFISPYDSLIRAWADTLGWDWKLLAALIYQESRFRIELRSPRGAEGLMQMMPQTAERYGCTDLTDPEQSIRAGALYLRKLSRRYRTLAEDARERQKFTLAAYNAGEGRIRDCINYARYRGVEPHRWEDIVALIPDMRHDSIADIDTVKLGRFMGHETIRYVDRVMQLHERYCRICR